MILNQATVKSLTLMVEECVTFEPTAGKSMIASHHCQTHAGMKSRFVPERLCGSGRCFCTLSYEMEQCEMIQHMLLIRLLLSHARQAVGVLSSNKIVHVTCLLKPKSDTTCHMSILLMSTVFVFFSLNSKTSLSKCIIKKKHAVKWLKNRAKSDALS